MSDLTDDEGDAVDGYTYDVFGAIRSQSGSSDNYWLFTGEQRDADSDMYYLRARFPPPLCPSFQAGVWKTNAPTPCPFPL